MLGHEGLEIQYGQPLRGKAANRLSRFLDRQGFEYEPSLDFTVNLLEKGEIVATGSLDGNIIKYVIVSPEHQSRGFAATIVTHLVNHATSMGRDHLLIFTRPEKGVAFTNLGFYPIAQTAKAMMLENHRGGLDNYLASLQLEKKGSRACVVAECAPFTNGHLNLIETAARENDSVSVFILSGDHGDYPARERWRMAAESTKHISNVTVHPPSPYLMPPHAFPDYYIDDKGESECINCVLELTTFARRIAKPLRITKRYIGTELSNPATASYNREMRRILPEHGVEMVELPHMFHNGRPINGSLVRSKFREGNIEEVRKLVPQATADIMIEIARHQLSAVIGSSRNTGKGVFHEIA